MKTKIDFVVASTRTCLSSGQSLSVIGLNGSGKSFWLKRLSLGSSALMISNNQNRIEPWDTSWLAMQATLWHEYGLIETLTVKENLDSCGLSLKSSDAMEHNFDWDSTVKNLSAGQKQYACLMRIKIANRPLWILDEPYAHLDDEKKDWWYHHMLSHVRNGGIVIQTAHQYEANRIALPNTQVVRL